MIQNLTSVLPHPVADADFPVVFSDICYGPTINWVGQSTMFTPHSSVQRQTSLGEPRSVSCCLHMLWPMTMCVRVINTFRIWPARKWEGKLWQRNKLWLLCFLWLLLSCFLLWILVEPVFNHMHSLTKGRQGLNVNEVMKRLQEVGGLQTSLISNPPIHQQRIFLGDSWIGWYPLRRSSMDFEKGLLTKVTRFVHLRAT